LRGRRERGSEEEEGEEGGREVVRMRRTGRERSREEEVGREVVRRRIERNEDEEGGREAVRRRMERKGEKGREEDDYFNKFPPTMPSVVLENRSIRMYKVSYRSAPK
jgi:hypothetical protein